MIQPGTKLAKMVLEMSAEPLNLHNFVMRWADLVTEARRVLNEGEKK